MDIHILDIQLRFYTTIVLGWWLYQTIFLSSRKVFQGKPVILYLLLIFFLLPNMVICLSDIFSNTTVMTSFHFETLFSTQPINLAVEEISQSKSNVQTPITYFINQKEKHLSIRPNNILTLMKSGELFFHIDRYYVHDWSWYQVFFSSLSQHLLWETCCKN